MGEYNQRCHVPAHHFTPGKVYIVTAGTYQKLPIFNTDEKLKLLKETIRERCNTSHWELRAWVALSNHYHLVAKSPEEGISLPRLIQSVHSKSAVLVNRLDRIRGRRVWYNYWDTCIQTERDCRERITYVLQNPQRHRLVEDYREYPYSNFGELDEQTVVEVETPVGREISFKIEDDF